MCMGSAVDKLLNACHSNDKIVWHMLAPVVVVVLLLLVTV